MTHYAWTLRARGRQDIQKVTTLAEMQDTLTMLELPGVISLDWIVSNAPKHNVPGHGHFTHNEGGADEWSLTWTKVDYGPGDSD